MNELNSEVLKTGAKLSVLKTGVTTFKVNGCLKALKLILQAAQTPQTGLVFAQMGCKEKPVVSWAAGGVDEIGQCGDEINLFASVKI